MSDCSAAKNSILKSLSKFAVAIVGSAINQRSVII